LPMPTATQGRYRLVGESSQNLAIPFSSPVLIYLSLTHIFLFLCVDPYFCIFGPLFLQSQSDPYFSV
jgi:hypothetical protein